MTDAILTLNAGSSSIKFAVFPVQAGAVAETPLAKGEASGIGDTPHLRIAKTNGQVSVDRALPEGSDQTTVLGEILDWTRQYSAGLTLIGAGHRVVHGGAKFSAPARVTPSLIEALAALTPLAPLHQPHNLAPIRALAASDPDLQQVACFDTGFHVTNTPGVTHYAIPRALTAEGVRRYGFHGLSYEYIATTLPDYLGDRAGGRVVVAHLGNGASMCAIKGGKSITSTMGFTALDGLPMGTRCGAIDPGVLLYLMKEKGMGYDELTHLLYHDSGLKGVSGISNDMRTLLSSAEPAAREAVGMFIYRITRELGSLAAALGGLDALVFTGGIGEHAAPVREGVCRASEWLGITLDADANTADGPRISRDDSPVPVFVIPTDEDLMIARHTAHLFKEKKDV